MADKVILGAGSHEPIFHRIRTGHASAGEWERWHRETTRENLDILQEVGVSRVLVACTKGFGFEVEKPLIERAARLREGCDKRGIQCDIYVQGLPVYYETFLLERPEAEGWMARMQTGEFYPWGGQTFRRWMDQYSDDFLEYEKTLIRHAVLTVRPHTVFIDNTVPPGVELYPAIGRGLPPLPAREVRRPGPGPALRHSLVRQGRPAAVRPDRLAAGRLPHRQGPDPPGGPLLAGAHLPLVVQPDPRGGQRRLALRPVRHCLRVRHAARQRPDAPGHRLRPGHPRR